MTLTFRSFLLFVCFCVWLSCTNDQLPEPTVEVCDPPATYTNNIKGIIDNACSYQGCHVVGFADGDYSSYGGLLGVINSGALKDWVVDRQEMPPPNAPADRPVELTEEELNLFKCWINDDYPE